MRWRLVRAGIGLAVLAAVCIVSAWATGEEVTEDQGAAPLTVSVPAGEKPSPGKLKPGPWKVLHLAAKAKKTLLRLPEDGPIQPIDELVLTGPEVGHPFLFGQYAINGQFGITGGLLQPSSGLNAACLLGTADHFELEGLVNAEGLGGWFLLFGWAEGRGQMIYNVNMKTSGCLWNTFRLVRGVAVKESHAELNRFEWKGGLPLQCRVANNLLSLRVGTVQIVSDLELTDYAPGEIILGTYDTKYGARPLKIQSLRIRPLTPVLK